MLKTFLLAVTTALVLAASPASKQLSAEQAESLARVVAEARLEGHHFIFDPAGLQQDFYWFGAWVTDIPGAEGHSGWYAVNMFTLEVWDPYGCFRYKNPELAKLQEKLRGELGITQREYQNHLNDDPCL